jgi:hypothetical protein
MRIATPDLVTNSYFPALAAEALHHVAGLHCHDACRRQFCFGLE